MADPFGSLDELRAAHAQLVKGVDNDVLAPGAPDRVAEFVHRAIQTGTVLDAKNDRAAAQGLINFWTSRLTSAVGELERQRYKEEALARSENRAVAFAAPAPQVPEFDDTLIEEFDEGLVKSAARRAEDWIKAQAPAERDLAYRLLARLVALPDGGRTLVPTPVPRADLDALGDTDAVGRTIAGLEEAGAVRVLPGGADSPPRIALQYDSFIRTWEAFENRLRKRVGLRDLARYWERHGRDAAALLSGAPLEEAEAYDDRNKLENEFVKASRAKERSDAQDEMRRETELAKSEARARTWLNVVMGMVALGAAMVAVVALVEWRRAESESKVRAERVNQFANKLLFIRNLASLTNASSPDEWEIGLLRFQALDEGIDDPFFEPFVERIQKATELPPKAYGPEADASKEVLAIAQEFRAQLVEQADPIVQPFLRAMREVAFRKTELVTEGIVTQLTNSPFGNNLEAYRKEFWNLYYGELAMFEGEQVEAAMVHFGEEIKGLQFGSKDAPLLAPRSMTIELQDIVSRPGRRASPKQIEALRLRQSELRDALDSERGLEIGARVRAGR